MSGKNNQGLDVLSGVYITMIQAGEYIENNKMLLARRIESSEESFVKIATLPSR